MKLNKKFRISFLVILILLFCYLAYWQFFMAKCSTNEGVRICISVESKTVRPGETIEVTTTVSNVSGDPLDYAVAVGESGYSIRINGEPRQRRSSPFGEFGGSRLPAFTPKELSRNNELTFTSLLRSSDLVNGKNQLQTRWMGQQLHESPEITITLEE